MISCRCAHRSLHSAAALGRLGPSPVAAEAPSIAVSGMMHGGPGAAHRPVDLNLRLNVVVVVAVVVVFLSLSLSLYC